MDILPAEYARNATNLYLELRRRLVDWTEDHIRYTALHLAGPSLPGLAKWLLCEEVLQRHEAAWDELCLFYTMEYISMRESEDKSSLSAMTSQASSQLERMQDLSPDVDDAIQRALLDPGKACAEARKKLNPYSDQDLSDIAIEYTFYVHKRTHDLQDDALDANLDLDSTFEEDPE